VRCHQVDGRLLVVLVVLVGLVVLVVLVVGADSTVRPTAFGAPPTCECFPSSSSPT